MQKVIKKRIGKDVHTFILDGDSLFDVLQKTQQLSFDDVDVCGVCNSDDLELRSYTTKEDGHKYIVVKCNSCRARLNFGQKKENPNVVYLRKRESSLGQKVLDWVKL